MPQTGDVPSAPAGLRQQLPAVLPGMILAGGLSSRMGETKAFLDIRPGETIIARIIATLSPQVDSLLLNAPGEFGRVQGLFPHMPRIPDTTAGELGPLAGVLSGLRHFAAARPQATHLLTAPSDSPFLPRNLAELLWQAIDSPQMIAVAVSNGRKHPVFAIWPVALADDLASWIAADDKRRMNAFLARHRVATVDFPEISTGLGPLDPFYNINTPEELAEARRFAAAMAEDLAQDFK